MAAPQDNLAIEAANLAMSSPQQWAEFMKCFAAYVDDSRDKLIRAPADNLNNAQGHAQALSKLQTLLVDCKETSVTINQRKKSK